MLNHSIKLDNFTKPILNVLFLFLDLLLFTFNTNNKVTHPYTPGRPAKEPPRPPGFVTRLSRLPGWLIRLIWIIFISILWTMAVMIGIFAQSDAIFMQGNNPCRCITDIFY